MRSSPAASEPATFPTVCTMTPHLENHGKRPTKRGSALFPHATSKVKKNRSDCDPHADDGKYTSSFQPSKLFTTRWHKGKDRETLDPQTHLVQAVSKFEGGCKRELGRFFGEPNPIPTLPASSGSEQSNHLHERREAARIDRRTDVPIGDVAQKCPCSLWAHVRDWSYQGCKNKQQGDD